MTERVLRFAAPGAVLAVLAGCWWMTAAMSAGFDADVWRAPPFGALFAMWTVMMAAMMAPAAAPFLLLFWRFAARQNDAAAAPFAAGGYFLVWTGFSAAAAALQFFAAGQLNDSMALDSPHARAALFFAAGVYQWTPLKFACLRGCRPPPLFLMLHWRRGAGGAFWAGARHGAYCAGCCWALMLLLFAGGVMDWRWILALTIYALAEKTLPYPERLAKMTGAVLFLFAAAEWFAV